MFQPNNFDQCTIVIIMSLKQTDAIIVAGTAAFIPLSNNILTAVFLVLYIKVIHHAHTKNHFISEEYICE